MAQHNKAVTMGNGHDLVEFEWAVPESGYEWISAKPLGQLEDKNDVSKVLPFLARTSYAGQIAAFATAQPKQFTNSTFLVARNELANEEGSLRQFNPFSERRELFRDFSDLSNDPEDFVRFANRYGHLGDSEFRISLHPPDTEKSKRLSGEPLIVWQFESDILKQAVFIWDLHRRNERGRLAAHFQRVIRDKFRNQDTAYWRFWREPRGWELNDGPRGALLWDNSAGRLWVRENDLASEDKSDLHKVALKILQNTTNEQLSGRLSANLSPQSDSGELVLSLRPTSLIGAIWLQFAQAVSNHTEFRRCTVCGSWMEISENASRRDKSYCSDACRMRAYRARKASKPASNNG